MTARRAYRAVMLLVACRQRLCLRACVLACLRAFASTVENGGRSEEVGTLWADRCAGRRVRGFDAQRYRYRRRVPDGDWLTEAAEFVSLSETLFFPRRSVNGQPFAL